MEQRRFCCDWCGFEMIQRQCKVICANCGARWDCSDLTIWVGDAVVAPPAPSGSDGLTGTDGK